MLIENLASLPMQIGEYPARRSDGRTESLVLVAVAEEIPIAIVYNGISHAVMLGTPGDFEDFALGFSLSEAIIERPGEIYDVEARTLEAGIEIAIVLASERFVALKDRRRNLAGRTGCGICGTESIEQAVRWPTPVQGGVSIGAQALRRALDELRTRQDLHASTGAAHAAAWADRTGRIEIVRQDIGRHNALDKLIGAMARARVPFDRGFVLLTSRASSEMIQKAATVGISLVAAMSAPTGLAIRLAEQTGVTLAGLVREDGHVVYANPGRIGIDSDGEER